MFKPSEARAAGAISLSFTEVYQELADLNRVHMWAFRGDGAPAPRLPSIPGPVLLATEGDTLDITVNNPPDEPHAFAIRGPGNVGLIVDSGPLAPGASGRLVFPAPTAGTYLY